ncbi:MAG: GNAT family N-acetyltransferase [Christensenellales bacterium]
MKDAKTFLNTAATRKSRATCSGPRKGISAKRRTTAATCCCRYRADEPSSWGIIDRQTRHLVGTIGYMDYSMDNASVEIGYSLARWLWNGGYMTEALARVIDYTFESMDINRIEAQHELDNPASGRVMEKCGMRKEGVLRQRLYNKGKFVDVALYAILKSDPRKPVGVPSQALQGN